MGDYKSLSSSLGRKASAPSMRTSLTEPTLRTGKSRPGNPGTVIRDRELECDEALFDHPKLPSSRTLRNMKCCAAEPGSPYLVRDLEIPGLHRITACCGAHGMTQCGGNSI